MAADRKSTVAAARAGLGRGLRTGWFLVRLIIPLSAGVAILEVTGALAWIGRALSPAMGLFGLPGEAAVAIVSGFLVGVSGGVAVAAALPLTVGQMTVLAIMILTAHNLIVESAVQSRSGTSGAAVAGVRVGAALLLGALLSWTLARAGALTAMATRAAARGSEQGLAQFFLGWARGAAILVVKIFVLVVLLTLVNDLMRAWGVFDRLAVPMRPIMRFLGLSERVAFLWITATFLGIAYGAGLILEEARRPEAFEPGDLRDLHVSTGIAHSLLEDTLLFVTVGAHPLWILAPRPFAAALVVRAARGFVPERPVAGSGPTAAPVAVAGKIA